MKMFRILWLILISCSVFCAASVPKDNDDGELELVSVIFRHGARTTTSFYPNDPHKGETFYPIGLGALTNEGKMGEYKLGQYLKNYYGDFLGNDYTEDKVWVRSVDITRTKMSAQLVLAGLFPPSEVLMWNKDLMWQPIPVEYKTDAEEDLFHPTSNCPYKKQVIANLPNNEEVQKKYLKPFEDLFQYTQNYSGKTIKVLTDIQSLYFNLKCEDDMNYTLPEWTESVYPDQFLNAASLSYSYSNYDAGVKKINAGYILKHILDNSKNKMDGSLSPKDRKIFLYSGQEITIGYMLDALQAEEPHIPPYSSAVSFELRKKKDEYYIKLRYRNSTEATEPKDLNIPGCDILCPYDKFVSLLVDVIPTESIQDACSVEKENDKKLHIK